MPLLPQDKHYAYSEYLTCDAKTRYELIDGIPYMMSPAPSRIHQDISTEILGQL